MNSDTSDTWLDTWLVWCPERSIGEQDAMDVVAHSERLAAERAFDIMYALDPWETEDYETTETFVKRKLDIGSHNPVYKINIVTRILVKFRSEL